MTAHKSILLAIDLATAQREQAQAQLQKARQADAHAQGQMQQLQDYLQEIEQRWMKGAQASTSSELLHHHYQFTTRLNQAIALQSGVLQGSRARVDAAQQHLLSVEIRLASFKQLLTNRRATQADKERRREQRQMDEFANLQTQRRQRAQAENGL